MDFKDTILQLSDRILKLKESIETEEATKNAFVMPMINALGYDVFNPLEVVPEYTCDIGTKKGEKIDYAIMKDGNTSLLIECKGWKQELNLLNNQLLRYYHVSSAKFGILTNGIKYRFYTDIDKSNVMDERPFLEIDMLDLTDANIEQLKKFHKSYFNESDILSTANELRLIIQIKNIIRREFAAPSTEFVKLFVKEINDGKYSTKQIEQYEPLVKRCIQSYINDVISERLNVAIETGQKTQKTEDSNAIPKGSVYVSEDRKIVTTQEEIDAFIIIKNILRKNIDVSRIAYKDYQSYMVIAIDGTLKWVCRLYFNKNKYVSFPAENGKEEKIEIKSLDGIYSLSDKLIESLKSLL